MKLILAESQKNWTFSDKVDRFRKKKTILRPNFRNKLFFRLKLSKNVFNKNWFPKLIFFDKKIV